MSRDDLNALNATAASLLGFLHDSPKTGWDLVDAIEHSVGYFWNVTRSQVYRELKTLAAAGYVAEQRSGARDKVPYEITGIGKEAFARWIASEPGPEILRLPIVLTVFFGRELAPETLRGFLDRARHEHKVRLDEYLGYAEEGPKDANEFQRKTLELGIAYERMMLGWLDGLARIKSGANKGTTTTRAKKASRTKT